MTITASESIKSRCLTLFLAALFTIAAHAACVDLTNSAVTFAVNHYEYKPISFTANEDVDILLPDDSWIQTAEVPSGTVAAGTKVRFYVAPDGPAVRSRSAVISFRGRDTNSTKSVTISQDPVSFTDNACPARWHYALPYAQESEWMLHGYAPANLNNGANTAVITAVGTNNRRLGHITATTFKQCPGLSNLYTGDYLLVSLPVKSLDAGTDIDFMILMAGNDNTAPKHWITEILDGGQWCTPQSGDMHKIDGQDYSFYTKYFPSYQHSTYMQSFRLQHPITDGLLQLRCRVVGNRNGADGILSPDNCGAIYLPAGEFNMCAVTAHTGVPVKDEKKIAILGNSFTYYHGEPFMLKEIARSQGHQTDIRAFTKGSQYFHHFLELERPKAITEEPAFDAVIIQDQSQQHCRLADGETGTIIADTKALTAKFRQGSPSARIILENTWASPKDKWNGYKSAAKFTKKLLEGATEVTKADPNTDCLSPVGVAFHTAYKAGIPGLWHTDSKHPGLHGSYLKACVHYLVIYGQEFTHGVADCGVEPAMAAKLREIAQHTVLGHENNYFIKR